MTRSGAFATRPQAIPAFTEQNRRPYWQTSHAMQSRGSQCGEDQRVAVGIHCDSFKGIGSPEALKHDPLGRVCNASASNTSLHRAEPQAILANEPRDAIARQPMWGRLTRCCRIFIVTRSKESVRQKH